MATLLDSPITINSYDGERIFFTAEDFRDYQDWLAGLDASRPAYQPSEADLAWAAQTLNDGSTVYEVVRGGAEVDPLDGTIMPRKVYGPALCLRAMPSEEMGGPGLDTWVGGLEA